MTLTYRIQRAFDWFVAFAAQAAVKTALLVLAWLAMSTYMKPVAAGFMIALIYIHELGHYFSARITGVGSTKGIYFLPYLGAVCHIDRPARHHYVNVIISLMGPAAGCLGSFILLGTTLAAPLIGHLWLIGNQRLLVAVAIFNAYMNFANLLPYIPLDGGHTYESVMSSLYHRELLRQRLELIKRRILWVVVLFTPAGLLLLQDIILFQIRKLWRKITGAEHEPPKLHYVAIPMNVQQRRSALAAHLCLAAILLGLSSFWPNMDIITALGIIIKRPGGH